MDQHAMFTVQAMASVLSSVLVLVALFLLWSKSQSTWLLLALLGEGISLLLRFALAVAPAALSAIPMMPLIWSVTGLLVAAGLLGFALEASNRKS
jgi:hypothetical protein